MNWHELDGAKAAIDPSNKLVDCRSQVLILFDVLAGRHSKLYQYDLSNESISEGS